MSAEAFTRTILKRIVSIAGTVYGVGLLLLIPGIILSAAGIFGLVVLVSATGLDSDYEHVAGSDSANQVLVIPVKGEILSEDDGSVPTDGSAVTYGYAVKDQLEAAAGDDAVKAVVLAIDSPGGTITGTQAIADAVSAYRETTKRPIIAYVAGQAASGAYWSAASTDAIVADRGTDVGSVGVISGPYEYYDTVIGESTGSGAQIITQNGIQHTYITAGTGKDLGNPFRRLTPAETANLQRGVNNEYANFVNYVSSRRNIPAATITGQLGALTYDPATALSYRLIDGIAGRDDAYREAAVRANLGDDYAVVRTYDYAQDLGWYASGVHALKSLAGRTHATARRHSRSAASQLCSGQQRLVYAGNLADRCAPVSSH